ncbi:MAG: septum formation protein Maf [Spirochaetales bacterium]|nr:septum formation protein Maf [Spirochaetales bacterium]
METITLGSASPRRAEILDRLGINYIIRHPNINEEIDPLLSIEENSKKISIDKLNYIKKNYPHDKWILTADTFIEFENCILGKPVNREDAFKMLKALSGNKHIVLTGVSIYSKKLDITVTEIDKTAVIFKKLSDKEIDNYLNFNEWIDAAGSYQIQNRGEILIDSINGSFSSVMGLPLSRIYGMFVSLNFY